MAGTAKYDVPGCKGFVYAVGEPSGKDNRRKQRAIKREKDGSFQLHEDDVKAMKKHGFAPTPWNQRGAAIEVGEEGKAAKPGKTKAKAGNKNLKPGKTKKAKTPAAGEEGGAPAPGAQ